MHRQIGATAAGSRTLDTMTTDSEWQAWGIRDPYFAVLTNPKYRSAALTPELKREFFESGRITAETVLRNCRSYLDPNFSPARVLDFGCGVARMAIPFASIAKEVVGMDVAETMLSEARRNCAEHGCDNITLVLSDDSLSLAPGLFDLVHSCIVLQHVEIARGRVLFKALVDKIKPGGCGAIQLPFAWDVYAETFGVAPPPEPISPTRRSWNAIMSRLLRRKAPATPPRGSEPNDPEMQMNYYSLSELMFILERAGVHHVASDFTNHGGAIGVFIYFQKGFDIPP